MIFKIKRQRKDFFQCSNSAIEQPGMSFKAKGVLCYLLSKPDDWTPRVGEISEVGPDGKESVQSALRELMKFGYATLEISRGELGQVGGRFWQIYEEPVKVADDGVCPTTAKTVRRLDRPTEKPVGSNTPSLPNTHREQNIDAGPNVQPLPPQPKPSLRSNILSLELPSVLETEIFRAWWTKWVDFRLGSKRVSNWVRMFEGHIDGLKGFTEDECVMAIKIAISEEYRRPFPKHDRFAHRAPESNQAVEVIRPNLL